MKALAIPIILAALTLAVTPGAATERRVTFKGTVVDAAGKPVGGAEVAGLLFVDLSVFHGDLWGLTSTQTGKTGVKIVLEGRSAPPRPWKPKPPVEDDF